MSNFKEITCEFQGVEMKGLAAFPQGDRPFPAILMFPGATGWGKSFLRTAEELSKHGYLVVAAGVYGKDADLSTPEKAGQHMQAMLENPEILRGRVVAWFDSLAATSVVDPQRMAALGYCFGGKCVLELARSGADLQAVISYHGIPITHAPAQPGEVKAQVIAYCGGQDPYAPMDQVDGLRQELEAAGADHQITVFSYAQHSFTDPDHDDSGHPGIAYHPLAHRVTWAGTLSLLDYMLKQPALQK